MGIPQRIIQNRMETCWAACMECWTREAAYYGGRIAHQEGLANQYGESPNGGLNSNGDKINGFTNEFWLKRIIVPGGQLTSARVERWLNDGWYFMIVEQTSAGTSHARLIYKYEDGFIYGMDPDPGMHYPVKASPQNLPASLVFYLDINKLPRA